MTDDMWGGILCWAIGFCACGMMTAPMLMVYIRGGERREWERCVRIIEQVVAKEMGGFSSKDLAAQLAARVFIAAIGAKYRSDE